MSWFAPIPVAHDHPPHPLRHLLRGIEAVWPLLITAIATALHPIAAIQPLAARIALALRRLQRARARILAILTACAEGTWQNPRPRQPIPRKRTRAPAPYLPRRRAWLAGATSHEVRALASQLTHLLADPGAHHILAAAPAQARAALARTMRGPARLLGLDLPSCLQFAGPPRPPRKRKPTLLAPLRRRGEPEGGVLPTDRPIPRYVLAFTRANRRRFGPGG